MRILYVCDSDSMGTAEYSIQQSRALANMGIEVDFLCRPTFDSTRLKGVRVFSDLPLLPVRASTATGRAVRYMLDSVRVARAVERSANQLAHDRVLISCYREYFAPLWARYFYRLRNRGVRLATVCHDPIRDFRIGPLWWHRWSVRAAYSFLDLVFVHDETPIDWGGLPPHGIAIHRIPHGPYPSTGARRERAVVRCGYGFGEADQVFLAFGQIRDSKNLDLFLRAMRNLPESVRLLVAGSSAGGSQRPPGYYQALSVELGVGARCSWDIRYIPDGELGDLLAASDYLLMCYNSSFRSASGVLNVSVSAKKPVLASSGPGPLKSSVLKYRLGKFVAPDDHEMLRLGAEVLVAQFCDPDWAGYQRDNTWEENAKIVAEVLLK